MASQENIDGIFFDSDLQEIGHFLQELDKIQQSTDQSAITEAANGLARLEDEFRYILVAYTTSNSTKSETLTDSSFSSPPSHFRLSISTNFSVNENGVPGTPAQELLSSDQNQILSTENQEIGDSVQKLSVPSIIISIPELTLIPIQSEAIYYLRCLVERMIGSGLTQECVQAYCSIRRPEIDATFQKLGIETLSTRQVQMLEWDSLEKKIKRWVEAAKVCFQLLFANEKMLLDQMFEGLSLDMAVAEACFLETVQGPAMQLLSFAQVVSTVSRRSLERLFAILDLYNALSNLMPDIEIVFLGRFLESIRVQALETLSKLAEAARGILEGFENAVLNEVSKNPTVGGGIHPLNRYVMKYMQMMSLYKQPLIELIVCTPPSMQLKITSGKSPLALHLTWIVNTLLSKLEEKSAQYTDASLTYLFMLNNIYYLVHKIESPELRAIIDDDYLWELHGKFRYAATNYLRSTWARVLHCLSEEELFLSESISSGNVRPKSILRGLKNFNANFEEVHKTQATWLVPDIQLREQLRISITEKLLPAYRSFLDQFEYYINRETRWFQQNYIKYSADDLENAVFLDFFEGRPHLRRKSHLNGTG